MSIVKSQRLVLREVFLTFLKYFEIIVPNHDYKHLFSIYLIGHSYFSAHLNTNSAFQKDIFLLQFSLLRCSELTTLRVVKTSDYLWLRYNRKRMQKSHPAENLVVQF